MKQRNNAGYTIIKSELINETREIVLGFNEKSEMYVTWQCDSITNYYWGHYFNDETNANLDLHKRMINELENKLICPFDTDM
jgi:hypothetical protein